MLIHSLVIEKCKGCLNIQQFTTHSDGFAANIEPDYVILITKISNFQQGHIVCVRTDEYSCVELGKILVICKKCLKLTRYLSLQKETEQSGKPPPKTTMHFGRFYFFTGFLPATSRGAVTPHKIMVGYSGWEKCIHPSC